ncbi:MAG: hypothetical protein R3E89_04245 [Thiolinea sp.]
MPANDLPGAVILQKMKEDEIRHGQTAEQAGGRRLPWPLRKLVMPLRQTDDFATTPQF